MEVLSVVGKRIPKVDAVGLVTGQAKYASDASLPGLLQAKFLRSRSPHARIKRIDTSKALEMAGVVAVITARDVPNNLIGLTIRDTPVLADDKVRFLGEPVAAVAAEDEETAERALELIEVEYEELPGVFDVEEALKSGAPLVHEDKSQYWYAPAVKPPPVSERNNISMQSRLNCGDVEQGFREADLIIEDRFTTQSVEQAPMEPHGGMASADSSGRVTLWLSTAKPFRIQSQIALALGLPLNKVKVIQTHTGGEFGGKGELTVEPACALLAMKTGRPVKAIYTREEEFTASSTRIPFTIDAKIGAMNDGRLVALQMKMLLDIGPYNGMGGLIGRWAAIVGAGPYNIPNVRLEAWCVYTNNILGGPFRGFGNPQASFAREVLLDRVAEKIGISPLELRLRSAWEPGCTTPTGQVLDPTRYGVGAKETLRRIEERTPWFGGTAGTQKEDRSTKRIGRGMATAVHGSGHAFLLGHDYSGAVVKVHSDGSVSLTTGATDVGQGSDTTLAQIVAEQLGIDVTEIALAPKDTDSCPYDSGSSASRVLYFAGNAALRAAADARAQLFDVAADELEARAEDLEAKDHRIFVKGSPSKSVALGEAAKLAYSKGLAVSGHGHFGDTDRFVDENGQGDPVSAFLFATQAAEVEVDTETGQVKVLKLVAAHDVGRAINPLIVEGQLEGGLMTGLGYTLTESILKDRGKVLNPTFVDYKLPTAEDLPELQIEIVEVPEPTGVFQAKGVGEPGLVPTAPAIANAVYDAVGVRINDLPITPERVLLALREKELTEDRNRKSGEGRT